MISLNYFLRRIKKNLISTIFYHKTMSTSSSTSKQKYNSYVLLSFITFIYLISIEGAFTIFYSMFLYQMNNLIPCSTLSLECTYPFVIYLGIMFLVFDILFAMAFVIPPIIACMLRNTRNELRNYKKESIKMFYFYLQTMSSNVITTIYLGIYFVLFYFDPKVELPHPKFYFYSIFVCTIVKLLFYVIILTIQNLKQYKQNKTITKSNNNSTTNSNNNSTTNHQQLQSNVVRHPSVTYV